MLDLNILDVIFGQFTAHGHDDGSRIVVMTARNMKVFHLRLVTKFRAVNRVSGVLIWFCQEQG